MEDSAFRVVSIGDAREKYGHNAFNRPLIKLDAASVPNSLRVLIPFAEQFGISDDSIREDVLDKTESPELLAMIAAVTANEDVLEDWLAGEAADQPPYSDEYVAFSALQMAADYCQVTLARPTASETDD